MARFFVDSTGISKDYINIEGPDVNHIKNVLRLQEGNEIVICDGEGNDFSTIIESINDKNIKAKIESIKKAETEPNLKVTLFQGLPKGDKMEYIIQKCVELGIDEIVPVVTSRAVVKLSDEKKMKKKIERWQKISESASKQSRRGRIPSISNALSYAEAIKEASSMDMKFIAYENENEVTLKQVLTTDENIKTLGFYVGPEGGFTEEEVSKAVEAGIKPITLGKRILRTETASISLTAMVMYHYSQM